MNEERSQAEKSLLMLVRHVFLHSLDTLNALTYQELAKQIGRVTKHGEGHGHGMGKILGEMGRLLQDLEGTWGEPIPHIHSLVVNKTGSLKDLPDDGIKEFWPDYPILSKEEKLNKVRVEYARIVDFGSRWDSVLSELGLPTIKNNSVNQQPSTERRYGRNGESPQHKALKNYISEHPELVGANPEYEVIIEYPFPSLDVVDVLFKSPTQWIAVEVKSAISDRLLKDYERGIYQCVKYHALFKAMQKDSNYATPSEIRVILLLEKRLPDLYQKLAENLDVPVIEGVTVPREKV